MISLLALASLGAGAQNLQKGDYGYLYCHMSGRGEWTAYALSRDGVHFHDLIDGDPVYNVEEMSKIEGGSTRCLYLPHVRWKRLPDGDYRHEQYQEPLVVQLRHQPAEK